MNKLLTLILTITLASTSLADPLGGQAGSFLRLGLGADRVAIGDVGVSMKNAGLGWYYNPASISSQDQRQFTAGYRFLSLDRSFSYFSLSAPLKGNAGAGISYARAATDKIDSRDSNGDKLSPLSLADNVIAGSFSLRPHPAVSVGISIKYIFTSVPTVLEGDKTLYANGMGIDFGLRVQPREWISFGAVLKDIGAKYSWDTFDVWHDDGGTVENVIPKTLRVGVDALPIENLDVAADLVTNLTQVGDSPDAFVLHAGGEYSLPYSGNHLAIIRAGWNGESPAFGLGIDIPLYRHISARFNYAFVFEKVAPSGSHLIDWTFTF